jgi:hypothetical protein
MKRVLALVSADFGEYVTASLFCRGQPFEARFVLPPALAPYAERATVYRSFADVERLVEELRPDLLLLASGYLFAVNNLASPAELDSLLEGARRQGVRVATTDPWLRIWAFSPATRFAIHSVRRGGEDAALSGRMNALQASLEARLEALPHLFAVPLAGRAAWRSFFNPALASRPSPSAQDLWLFVLSREDLAFAGAEARFHAALEARVEELLARSANRLVFVAPPAIGRFLAERWPGEPRLEHFAACDFARFEALVREASVVAYWNLLSSSLLYCLYFGVPPIFFGAGHMAKVCPGLEAHAARQVYRDHPPRIRSLDAPLEADPGRLIREERLDEWVLGLRAEYARSSAPAQVLESLLEAA